MNTIPFLVAGDPDQTTGGSIYDARIADTLGRAGVSVKRIGLDGRFPLPDAAAEAGTADALRALPDDASVIIDGLVMGGLAGVVAREARRLRIIVLVHHPLADEAGLDAAIGDRLYDSERRALPAARRIVVTSRFTARRLVEAYDVPRESIDVVEPGLERPTGRPGPPDDPPRLLCVASLIPRKGHRVLIEALASLSDLDWECECIGDLARDPDCTAQVRGAIARYDLSRRVHLAGSRPAAALAAAYNAAYLHVLPSYYEGYGMVVTEALGHGRPVVTTTGGALAETLPADAGIAIPPGDSEALAAALRRLLCDRDTYDALAAGARRAAAALPDWDQAARRFAAVIERVRDA